MNATPTPQEPIIEASLVSKHYGSVTAVRELTLTVGAGEIFCLLGANGAGKTTTLNLLLGFTAASSGSLRVAGVDVARSPDAARQHLAYIPEQVALYPLLSGLENLQFFSRLGRSTAPTAADCRARLAEVGLDPAACDRRVGEYSKGMRQKVGIAIALARNASALLLDEPMSGLDPKAANEFGELLTSVAGRGAAVLMATHDLFRAQEIGTHVGIMKRGVLLEIRRTAELTAAELERVYLAHMR